MNGKINMNKKYICYCGFYCENCAVKAKGFTYADK